MNSQRQRWPSRTLFIFAAIGSAVGLGNIWRFPYLVGKYGGGAFLIPYIFALFLLGLPLLIMEFAIGQKMQQGAVGTLTKIHKKMSGVGVGSLLCAFFVASYYAVIMSWCLIYIFHSFTLSWQKDPASFFLDNVLMRSASANEISGIVLPVFIALFLSWSAVYFCLWGGVKSVSSAVKITMPLPLLCLALLLLRVLFLPGAYEGIYYFLIPKMDTLLNIEVLTAAVTQVFFTLTLGFGVMITYASYQSKDQDIVRTALIICLSDLTIALTCGLVVFATLGTMAHSSGSSIASFAEKGPSLAFIAFPKALSLTPEAKLLSFVFFVMLVSLAIDSLFSLVEAVATFFEDLFPKISKPAIVFYVCFAGFLAGILFTTTAGIYYLDIADYFLTHYALFLMALLQAIAVGWFFPAEKLLQYINKVSDQRIGNAWIFAVKYFIPTLLSLLVLHTFIKDISHPYGNYPFWALWLFGWGLIATIVIVSVSYSLFQKNGKNESGQIH